MKFLNSQFVILVMAKATLGRDCALCPNGISSPDKIALQGELTCGELETGYKNQPVDVCNSIKGPIAEDCCPDQIDTLFMDNACGWCPNGISDPDLEVEFPMGSTDMFSCFNISILAGTVPASCSLYIDSESSCCPGDEGEVVAGSACQFCGNGGSELPDLVPDGSGFVTCDQLESSTLFLPQGTSCDKLKSVFEPSCCPSFTGDGGGSGGGGSGSDGGGGDGDSGGSDGSDGGDGDRGGSDGSDGGGGDDDSGGGYTPNVGLLVATGLAFFSFSLF